MTKLTTRLVQVDPGRWRLIGVDSSRAGQGEITLEALAEAHIQTLIIDLSAMSHVDSQGLRLLYDVHRGLRSDNVLLVLRNPSPTLHRLLKIMQFNRLFSIEFD